MYYLYNKTTEIRPNRAWKDVNGIQHPANWHIWSADYKASMNIEEIILDAKPDGKFHNWIDNGLQGISNITDKNLDDTGSELKLQQWKMLLMQQVIWMPLKLYS